MNHLLQGFAGLAVDCTQPDTEAVARVGDGSGNDGATLPFPAELHTNLGCDPGIFAQPEQRKGLMASPISAGLQHHGQ